MTGAAGPMDVSGRALSAGRLLMVRFAVVGGLSVLGAVVFVRELGTKAWATYTVAYFVTVLVDQTMGARFLGAVVKDDAAASGARLRAAVTVAHLFGLTVLAVSVICGAVLDERSELPDSMLMLSAAGICSYVYAARSAATALLERDLEFRPVVRAEILDQAVFYALSVPWVVGGGGLEGVAVALAIRGCLPAFLLLRRRPVPRPGRVSRDELRSVLAYAIPTLGATAFAAVEVVIPTIVLAKRPEDLAYFLTGGSIASYAAVLAFVAQRTTFPGLALTQRPAPSFARLVRGAADLNALLLTVMVVPFCAVSWWWYPRLLGSEWANAVDVLVVMSAGFVFGGIAQVVFGALYSARAAGSLLRINLSAAAGFTALVGALSGPLPHLAAPLALTVARAGVLVWTYRAAATRGIGLGYPGAIPLVGAVAACGWIHAASAQEGNTVTAAVAGAGAGVMLAAAALAARPLMRSAFDTLRAEGQTGLDPPEVVEPGSHPR